MRKSLSRLWVKLNEHKGTHLEEAGWGTNSSNGDMPIYEEVPNNSILDNVNGFVAVTAVGATFYGTVYYLFFR